MRAPQTWGDCTVNSGAHMYKSCSITAGRAVFAARWFATGEYAASAPACMAAQDALCSLPGAHMAGQREREGS